MTDSSPRSFEDGEFGWVPGVLLGGPCDGKRYKMPGVPDGSVPDGFGHPLRQPHQTSPYAWYYLASPDAIGGDYVYLFDQIRGPNQQSAARRTPALQATYRQPAATTGAATLPTPPARASLAQQPALEG